MLDFLKKQLESANSSKLSRYYTGAVLVGIVVLVIVLNVKFLSWILLGVCYFIAFGEALRLYNLEAKAHLYVSAGAIWLLAYFWENPIYTALVCVAILASYNAYYQNIKSRDYLVFFYPTVPFLCFWSIYNISVMAIVWLIIIVALADTCAYFGGRAFGKTPLSPVSPKKTIEGALIGLIVATLIGTIIGMGVSVNDTKIGFIVSFFITVLVALISIFGDLYESMLKRAANVKDSGNILPGHGGMLDRVDGILFGAIMMIFLLEWVK